MKVPYQLRCLSTSAPAAALLVPGPRVEDALAIGAELGADPLPSIYAVADGFLLRLPAPSEKQLAGVIRLRGLAEHLFVPVHAELLPALLPDEAEALVRKRGLVFLPGNRVLEYDPAQPLPLSALLKLAPIARRPWRALPAPPALADDITEITLLAGDPTADDVLQAGGAGIGTESPQLEGGSLPGQMLGKTMFGLGKGLAWLGKALNAKALAGLGAKLLGGAMSLMPPLSAKLMGEQEAKLRELLRQFREGNIENALKHALPLGGDMPRGVAPAQSARLPTHNLFYSLIDLLGSGGGGGPGSYWFTPDNTYYELLGEYRKQAELAVSRGDFRRAAFVYARLLNDYHTAAKVLAQGGLHRDAAVLYEKKLRDRLAAAKEWEAAGEFDRAVQIYRQMGDHLTAGDLLRRIGEEERAVKEYQIAAARLLDQGPQHYEAGEILRTRAERSDLAYTYYEKGWQVRPQGNALLCATRMVQQHAAAGESEPLLAVLGEAEAFLAEREPQTAATFFTEIASLARTPPLAPVADELHDRALVGIAKKMRQRMDTPALHATANLLTAAAVWTAPLVGDCQHALNLASKRAVAPRPIYSSVRAGNSVVTAVAQMPMGSQVFLGFENGEVMVYHPATGAVHTLTRESGPILSLVVDSSKTYLVILSQMTPEKVCLRVVSREVGYRMIDYYWQTVTGPARLGIPALNSQADFTVLWFGNEGRIFTLPNLVGTHSISFNEAGEPPEAILYGGSEWNTATRWVLAINHTGSMLLDHVGGRKLLVGPPGWSLGMSEETTLQQVQLRCMMSETSDLDIVGLDRGGSLHRFTVYLAKPKRAVETIGYHPSGRDPYHAFACVRDDLLAGVHPQGIDWWTPSRTKPVQTKIALGNPIAAFPLPETRELLVIGADGLLTRVAGAE